MELLLKDHVSRVLQLQSEAGYKESTLSFYRIAYNRLEVLAEQMNVDVLTEKLANAFLEDRVSRRTGTICKSRCQLQYIAVMRLKEYAATGQINWKHNVHNKSLRKTPDTMYFRRLLEDYLAFLIREGKKKNTVDGYRNVASSFLIFCENQKIFGPATLTPVIVANFFKELTQTWSPLSIRTAASALKSLLTFTQAPNEAIQSIPLNSPRKTAIPQVLTEDQEIRLWKALGASETSARDRALVTLLFVTGLRPVDATHLLLDDIDWKKGLIHLVQQKTDRQLILPLAPAVGNAIMKYLTAFRPASHYRNVFLKSFAPYTPLTDHSACYSIIHRLFRQAGITRQEPAAGGRLFRSGTASNLLKAGVPLPHIAACLGHSDPESSQTYLSIDRERMQLCILPFPLKGKDGEEDA